MRDDLIRVDNPCCADNRFQDGALPHVTGVKSYQVLRANRAHPEWAEGTGWTYNHAAMLAWAYGRFFLEYLSNPVSEHEVPGHTLLTSSTDGVHWSKPVVAFPTVRVPTAPYRGPRSALLEDTALTVPHQRMGFFHGSNGALLVLSFYGIVHDRHVSAPCDGWGVGRAVRRVREDGTLAEGTWFLMYNEAAGYTEANTPVFAPYQKSGDPLLIDACDELMENGAVLRQMYEEQRFDRHLFPTPGAEALSFYTVGPEEMIGMYKKGLVSFSHDGGKSWTEPARQKDICTATGKVWGQRTSDGRYVLMYNPTTDGQHRWPIAAVTGEDGYHFGGMAAITGEMSPQRYGGLDKILGPQFMRGIAECNPQSPDGDVWLAYSNNKEDIWISHIPVPIASTGSAACDMRFTAGIPRELSVYAPVWCPVTAEAGDLVLRDRDPYDLAAVEANFAAARQGELCLELMVEHVAGGIMLEIQNEQGRTPIRLVFRADSKLWVRGDGRTDPWMDYALGQPLMVRISFDCDARRYTVSLNGQEKSFGLSAAVDALHRFRLTTKERMPAMSTLESVGKYGRKEQVLAGCEEPMEETAVRVRGICWRMENSQGTM